MPGKMKPVSLQTRFRVAADYLDGVVLKEIRFRYGLDNDSRVLTIAGSMGCPRRTTNFAALPETRRGRAKPGLIKRKPRGKHPRTRNEGGSWIKERIDGDQSSSAH